MFQDPFGAYNPVFRADRIFGMMKEQYFPPVSAEQWRAKLEQTGDTVRIFDSPLHPYTKMLMASVPRLDSTWSARDAISVEAMEDAQLNTGGCVYYGRCPIGSRDLGCHERHPRLVEAEDDHMVTCYAVEHDLPLSWRSNPVSVG